MLLQEALEGWVDVDEVDLAGLPGKGAGEVFQAALEDRREEGVVEVEDDGAGWVVEGGGVAVVGFDLAALLPGGGEVLDVDGGVGAEFGGEFDSDDALEGEAGGEEEGAAFAGAEVEEGEALPVEVERAEELGEERGGDAVVGGAPEVVAVARGEVLAPDEAAGVGAVGEVEGMDEAGRAATDVAVAIAGGRAGGDRGGRFDEVKTACDLLEDGGPESPGAAVHEHLQESADDGSGHS